MTKVISLSDDAYDTLSSLKMPGDSFSEVVKRIAAREKKASFMDFAGIWKNKPEMGAIFKGIAKDRKRFRTRDYVLP